MKLYEVDEPARMILYYSNTLYIGGEKKSSVREIKGDIVHLEKTDDVKYFYFNLTKMQMGYAFLDERFYIPLPKKK